MQIDRGHDFGRGNGSGFPHKDHLGDRCAPSERGRLYLQVGNHSQLVLRAGRVHGEIGFDDQLVRHEQAVWPVRIFDAGIDRVPVVESEHCLARLLPGRGMMFCDLRGYLDIGALRLAADLLVVLRLFVADKSRQLPPRAARPAIEPYV